MARNTSTLVGFLITCFVVVGMTGLFALYAVPIPLERAAVRDGLLDEVLLKADQPDALAALRPQLGDRAPAVLDGPGPLAGRVARERTAMHAELLVEEHEFSRRVLWLIMVVTICAGAFGSMLLVLASRRQS